MAQFLEWRLLAGSVRSSTAASEHSSSQNMDLPDRPLWRTLDGRIGSSTAVRQGLVDVSEIGRLS